MSRVGWQPDEDSLALLLEGKIAKIIKSSPLWGRWHVMPDEGGIATSASGSVAMTRI